MAADRNKGRYSSASEVMRLVEEREARLTALRKILNASITVGGDVSDDELDAALAEAMIEMEPAR